MTLATMSFGNEPLIDRHVHSYLSDLLDPSDYRDLLRGAVAQLIDAAACLHRPLGEAELGALAHRIKGSLGSMGLARLALVAAQVEGHCRQGLGDAQDGLWLRGTIAETRRALESLLKPSIPLRP
jgi:HPt (histidine-containing phosphotransfer) domain-containing protein